MLFLCQNAIVPKIVEMRTHFFKVFIFDLSTYGHFNLNNAYSIQNFQMIKMMNKAKEMKYLWTFLYCAIESLNGL